MTTPAGLLEYGYFRVTFEVVGGVEGGSYYYGYAYTYQQINFQAGDVLQYDVRWVTPNAYIAVDLGVNVPPGNLRYAGAVDQNGLDAHPATFLPDAYDNWYSRQIPLDSIAGGDLNPFYIACEADTPGLYTADIRNVRISRADGTVSPVNVLESRSPYFPYYLHYRDGINLYSSDWIGATYEVIPSNYPNELFANATELTGASGSITPFHYGGSDGLASYESDEQYYGAGETLWWKWTCPADGHYFFSTNGSYLMGDTAGSMDTVLTIFSGTPQSANYVTYNDDGDVGVNSYADFDATAGTTYYIQLDHYSAADEGFLYLNWGLDVRAPLATVTVTPQQDSVVGGRDLTVHIVASNLATDSMAVQVNFYSGYIVSVTGADTTVSGSSASVLAPTGSLDILVKLHVSTTANDFQTYVQATAFNPDQKRTYAYGYFNVVSYVIPTMCDDPVAIPDHIEYRGAYTTRIVEGIARPYAGVGTTVMSLPSSGIPTSLPEINYPPDSNGTVVAIPGAGMYDTGLVDHTLEFTIDNVGRHMQVQVGVDPDIPGSGFGGVFRWFPVDGGGIPEYYGYPDGICFMEANVGGYNYGFPAISGFTFNDGDLISIRCFGPYIEIYVNGVYAIGGGTNGVNDSGERKTGTYVQMGHWGLQDYDNAYEPNGEFYGTYTPPTPAHRRLTQVSNVVIRKTTTKYLGIPEGAALVAGAPNGYVEKYGTYRQANYQTGSGCAGVQRGPGYIMSYGNISTNQELWMRRYVMYLDKHVFDTLPESFAQYDYVKSNYKPLAVTQYEQAHLGDKTITWHFVDNTLTVSFLGVTMQYLSGIQNPQNYNQNLPVSRDVTVKLILLPKSTGYTLDANRNMTLPYNDPSMLAPAVQTLAEWTFPAGTSQMPITASNYLSIPDSAYDDNGILVVALTTEDAENGLALDNYYDESPLNAMVYGGAAVAANIGLPDYVMCHRTDMCCDLPRPGGTVTLNGQPLTTFQVSATVRAILGSDPAQTGTVTATGENQTAGDVDNFLWWSSATYSSSGIPRDEPYPVNGTWGQSFKVMNITGTTLLATENYTFRQSGTDVVITQSGRQFELPPEGTNGRGYSFFGIINTVPQGQYLSDWSLTDTSTGSVLARWSYAPGPSEPARWPGIHEAFESRNIPGAVYTYFGGRTNNANPPVGFYRNNVTDNTQRQYANVSRNVWIFNQQDLNGYFTYPPPAEYDQYVALHPEDPVARYDYLQEAPTLLSCVLQITDIGEFSSTYPSTSPFTVKIYRLPHPPGGYTYNYGNNAIMNYYDIYMHNNDPSYFASTVGEPLGSYTVQPGETHHPVTINIDINTSYFDSDGLMMLCATTDKAENGWSLPSVYVDTMAIEMAEVHVSATRRFQYPRYVICHQCTSGGFWPSHPQVEDWERPSTPFAIDPATTPRGNTVFFPQIPVLPRYATTFPSNNGAVSPAQVNP